MTDTALSGQAQQAADAEADRLVTRSRKTPAEKATERARVAANRVERLTEKRDDLDDQLTSVRQSITESRARLRYAAADPDLPDDVRATLYAAGLLDVPEDDDSSPVRTYIG